MEEHLILHQTHYGRITQCSYCGCIKLAFGNIIFNVIKEDFESFGTLINQLAHKYRAEKSSGFYEKVIIQMDIPDFFIALNRQELHWLDELIKQATLMLTVNTVLQQAG